MNRKKMQEALSDLQSHLHDNTPGMSTSKISIAEALEKFMIAVLEEDEDVEHVESSWGVTPDDPDYYFVLSEGAARTKEEFDEWSKAFAVAVDAATERLEPGATQGQVCGTCRGFPYFDRNKDGEVVVVVCPACGRYDARQNTINVLYGIIATGRTAPAEPSADELYHGTIAGLDGSVNLANSRRLVRKAPAEPDETAVERASLVDRLRERTALRYAGDCKCGCCQLVSNSLLTEAIAALTATAAPARTAGENRNG